MLKAAAGADGDGDSSFTGVTYLQHKDTKFRIDLNFFASPNRYRAPVGDYF
jgi:hypothetical protein